MIGRISSYPQFSLWGTPAPNLYAAFNTVLWAHKVDSKNLTVLDVSWH